MSLKNTLCSCLNRMGFDVIRLHRSPKRTLLGLAGWDIGAVIDVGANQGQFARFITGFFPRAQLYCFDPLYEGQADFFGLAGLLQKSGFRYAGNLDQAYGEDGRVVYFDAVFVRD